MAQADLNFNLALGQSDQMPSQQHQPPPPSAPSDVGRLRITKELEIEPSHDQKPQQIPQQEGSYLSRSSHPIAAIFHILFKALSLIQYFLIDLYTEKTTTFIIMVFLFAFDFWTVKNVTGRLLVGLKWWSEIDEQGNQNWRFESLFKSKANQCDSIFFWGVLYITPVFWIVWAFTRVLALSFFYLTICVIGVILTGANVIGYYKCAKDHQKKAKSFLRNQASRRIIGMLPGMS